MFFLFITYLLIFIYLTYRNFRWAVGLFIILLPSYLIRFSVGPFPSTILELSFSALFLVWVLEYAKNDFKVIKEIVTKHGLFFIFLGLFFLASIISILVSGQYIQAVGLWRAYFLEPLILFFILLGRSKEIKIKDLVWFLALSTLSISIFAIIQKLTGWGISTLEWTDVVTRRSTAFFSSPNAVGLFLAPIVMLVIASQVSLLLRAKRNNDRNATLAITILVFLAIYFSKSQGTWIGLGTGILVFVFLIGYRKIATGILVLGVITALIIPSLRQAILFQDNAGQNRILLWSESWNYLSESPSNFILGTGLRQFYDKIQKPVHNWQRIERHIYPHNIFLNFWTEIGLLGMLSFVGMLVYLFYLANKIRKKDLILGAGLISVSVVFLVHGLVDVPYFKNDLAFLFYILSVCFITSTPQSLARE
ncbi:MAG: O-antigen ligase family protein [bacterium]